MTCDHVWIEITKSSDGKAPYRMCSRCGERVYPPMSESSSDHLPNWLANLRQELAGTMTVPDGIDIMAPTDEMWDADTPIR